MTRAAVPFWFHEPETEEGRQALADAGEDGTRLPVMLFYSGSILVDPSNAEVIEELGITIRPRQDLLRPRGPRSRTGWSGCSRVRRRRKGSAPWWSNGRFPEVRPAPAH